MAEFLGVISAIGFVLFGCNIARLLWHAGSAFKVYANSKEGHHDA